MEKSLMHYLLVLVCSKENNAPRLAEEHLERDTSCPNRRTMAQRSPNTNIHSLGHRGCCAGASCQPLPGATMHGSTQTTLQRWSSDSPRLVETAAAAQTPAELFHSL